MLNNDIFSNSYIFNQRISWDKKKANDFEWAEKCAEYIDNMYSPLNDKDRSERLNMNYQLYNGHGEEAMKSFHGEDHSELLEEGITAGYEGIQHHPIIDQIAKALVGEQQLRPFTPIAFDSSGYSINDRKAKRLSLLQESIHQRVIAPLQEQVTQQYMMENKIEDPYKLSPEQQQQMQVDIGDKIESMTPKEINSYMRKDYKSPSEAQAQKLIDFLSDYLDIKYVTDEGFKHAIITGEEIYRVGIRHNMPFIELVNPMGFYHLGRPNSMFIEEGVAAKYEQYVMYSDIYNWHGDEIGKKKDIKKKLDYYASQGIMNPMQQVIDYQIYSNPTYLETAPQVQTQEGQEFLRNLLGGGSSAVKSGDIRHVHITWKALRRLKQIKRIDPKTKEKTSFWVDESYQFNPLNGDIKEYEAWVPEVWECERIGSGADSIYLNKRPVPYQYKSLSNPWDTKLPYIGAQYSKLMGNSKNVAPMDLGKPWQYKFNVQLAKIHELEATDMGKVFLTSFHAKPKNWSWQKFILMAKYGKIIPIDLQQEGVTPADAQIFKSLDLSTISDLAGKLQYLEFIKNQVALSMSYNPSRLGMQQSSVSVTNNQQNIMQSSYQTYDLFNTHNKVVENLMNVLINVARVAFKDNPPIKTYVLDDMSVAELDIDWEMLWRSELAIKVRNSSQDFENILQVRQQAQSMIQNGLISFPELIRLQWAKSGADIMNIAEGAEERMKQQQAEQQQAQQEQMQQQAEIQQQLQKMQQDFELLKQANELMSREKQAEIESTRFARQEDINLNQLDDEYEKEQMKIEADLFKFNKEMEVKMLEIELKYSDMDEKSKLEFEKLKTQKEIEFKKLLEQSKTKDKEIEVKRIAARKKSVSK